MSKTSDALGKDVNRLQVGLYGGTKPSDLNNSGSNRINRVSDRDKDGSPDKKVSTELSEDVNASHLNGGIPRRG